MTTDLLPTSFYRGTIQSFEVRCAATPAEVE
jgi:hypothetical protein